jgi:hypothetical protein
VDYTEPLSKKHFLVLGYNYTIKDNDIDKRTYDMGNATEPGDNNLISSLSNVGQPLSEPSSSIGLSLSG